MSLESLSTLRTGSHDENATVPFKDCPDPNGEDARARAEESDSEPFDEVSAFGAFSHNGND
jgi:hypothetical protein